jgi:hypothetical protein
MADENAEISANEGARSQSEQREPVDAGAEARARRMGWIPETDWDDASMERKPKKFLSADEYIDKVESDLPILRERNRFLDQTVAKQDNKLDQMSTQLKTAAERLEDLGQLVESLNEQNKQIGQRAYEAARRDLEAVKRRAVAEADEATYDEADRRLEELQRHRNEQQTRRREDPEETQRQRSETERKPAQQQQTQQQTQISQKAQGWLDDNKPLMADPVTNAIAVALHTQDLARGVSEEDSFRTLTDRIKKEVPHKFNNGRREEPSTVATTSPPRRDAKKKGFDSLPQNAKETYERLARYYESKGKKYTPEQYAQTYYFELERGQQ